MDCFSKELGALNQILHVTERDINYEMHAIRKTLILI